MADGNHGELTQSAQKHVQEERKQEHEFVLHHNMEENRVLEVLQKTQNVTHNRVQVSNYFSIDIWPINLVLEEKVWWKVDFFNPNKTIFEIQNLITIFRQKLISMR